MPLIRTTGAWPAGGWAFTDSRTGYRFPGMDCTFDEQVNRIIQFRLSNPRVFDPTKPEDAKLINKSEVASELDLYTCRRLGFDKRFCVSEGEVRNQELRQKYFYNPTDKHCPVCKDVDMVDRYCPTCSGNRIVGATCPKCGLDLQK